jgi:hypothetical protein
MSTYRFSWLRPGGWNRLGGVGAVATMFATPMMWALGVFGADDDTIKRSLIFLFAGMWFFVGTFYVLGWAIRGFLVKTKDHEEDEDGPAHRPAAPPHPPGAAVPHRPGH